MRLLTQILRSTLIPRMIEEEAQSKACEMAYYCDPEGICALLEQLNHQGKYGGEQPNREPCGEVFKAAAWDNFGTNLDQSSKKAHCPMREYILYRHGYLRKKKGDTGKLIMSPDYQEAA